MKKVLFVFILTTIVLVGCTGKKQARQTEGVLQQDKALELTFTFTRQSGHASNQFAVWIEDANGQHVKTIYATRFTANGGWRRRSDSIPNWVRQSDISNMTRVQTDAISGATPRTGIQNFIWDGTDSRGLTVPFGEYILFLEGTLRWENQVIYRVPIQFGGGAELAEVIVEYSGDFIAERSMIDNVMVQVFR
jgi:hypothetical protein